MCKHTFNLYLFIAQVNMLEIYNENVLDLLAHGSTLSSAATEDKSLEIRQVCACVRHSRYLHVPFMCSCMQGPFGLHVPDATTEDVACIEDVERLMTRGEHNRTVGFTNCNEHSSRSHRCTRPRQCERMP